MFIKNFKECLPYLFEANIATMVIGHHGVGKSQAVAQYAKEKKIGFMDLRLGTQDVGDLLGLAEFKTEMLPFTFLNEQGKKVTEMREEKVATKFMRPDWFPTDPDSKGIIFMDEINRARRDVLQAVFQLVLDKRLHTYELPKGWHVIAAMNPNTDDYIVTDISDKAFLDRFCHVKLAPSKDEWFNYAKSKGFEPDLLAFLKEQPGLLQEKLEDFSLQDVKPSRRSWEAMDRLYKTKIPVNLLQELARGIVGSEAATAFISSIKNADKPISGKNILEDLQKYTSRIKKYANAKTGGRMDLLNDSCESMLELIQGRKKDLTKKEGENLADFFMLLPKDIAFSFGRQLYLEEIARPIMDSHTELKKALADARHMKIKGLND